MNSLRNFRLPGALLGTFVCCAALAAQTPTYPEPASKPAQDKPAAERPATMPATTTAKGVFRASKLNGKNIVDSADAKVGEVKDVAVDVPSGALVAVVKRSSDGELAGVMLDQLVPKCETKDGKPDEKLKIKEFTLSGSADALKTAPTVKDVDSIDHGFFDRVHKGAAMGATGTDGNPAPGVVCVEKLVGMDVKDTSGADLGNVAELVVNLPEGKIAYLVISTGGVAGMGDTTRGVSWKSVSMDSSGKRLNLAADKAAFEKLPTVDLDHLMPRPDLQASATSSETGPVAQEPRR